MPTLAPIELIQHIETHGRGTPFPLHKRRPETPMTSIQSFVDSEIRDQGRYGPEYFRRVYEDTGFLTCSRYAFRPHPTWLDKEILWGAEPKTGECGICKVVEDYARPQEHLEIIPEDPQWVEIDRASKPTLRTFRFPPLGEDRNTSVLNIEFRSEMKIGEGEALDTRFVRTIVKFGHPKRLARNPPEVRFVQLVTREQQEDGSWKRSSWGNAVQIWRMDPWECIGFLLPMTERVKRRC